MRDFALLAEGFPKDSGETRLEEEYTAYFKEVFGKDDVVGVSICWHIDEFGDDVAELAQAELVRLEAEYEEEEEGFRDASTRGCRRLRHACRRF